MQLTMRKGQEHHLVIDQRLDDPDELMYSAYQQALEALDEIVRQARAFSSPKTAGGSSGLYGYAHNIIAFSGSRGQGKTSAMISFSDAMSAHSRECRKLPRPQLDRCSFAVLPPFDPTILEKNQSILAVVLSRMYRMAEDKWKSSGHKCSEADKNELLELFQKCLSGINAIKFRKGEEIKTLHNIDEISDSSLLKRYFYQLTESLLRFINEGSKADSFLVVQLDDTDFQIQKGYEILEDIRKYLTLPNVIILMATDVGMLHRALIQHFINEFEAGLRWEIVSPNDLRKLESKYLDKLIPPTFTVYLPHLDDMIRQRNELVRLVYIDPGEEAGSARERPPANLLLKPGCRCSTEDFSFQALLLRYIYRKTRIVFAEHSTYLHDLIPTTLRGLAQLLGLLSSMEDVPELGRDDPCLDDPRALAHAVGEQVDVLEANLALFENYFLNDWVHTKLTRERAEVIERLSAAVPALRCRLAVELLEGLYDRKDKKAASSVPDYTRMVRLLEDLKQAHRRPEDFYFFFAVHTFFTIQGHKAVARQKRRAVNAFEEEMRAGKKPLLLFDFSPESTGLPVWFDIPGFPEQVGDNVMHCQLEMESIDRLKGDIGSGYASSRLLLHEGPPPEDTVYFSVENLIGLFMSLGSSEGKELVSDGLSQRDLYLAQTSAAAIAINWDVQDKLLKLPEVAFEKSGDKMPQYLRALRMIWSVIDEAIESINACKRPDEHCPMVISCLESMVNFFDGDGGLQHALRAIEDNFVVYRPGVNHLGEIREVISHTQRLKKCLRQEGDNFEIITGLWNVFVDDCHKLPPEIREAFDLKLVNDKLWAYLRADGDRKRASAKGVFTRTLNRQLDRLCGHFGYERKLLEAAVKGGGGI